LPSLKAGIGLFESSSGTYRPDAETPYWETESDVERLGMVAEYSPNAAGRFLLNAGLQTNGNRTAEVNDRRAGGYYELSGTLAPLSGPWQNYRLLLSDKRAFVESNQAVIDTAALGGSTLFGNNDTLSVYAGYHRELNSSFFYARTDRTVRDFSARVSKRLGQNMRNAALFSVSRNAFNFPDDPLNNKRDFSMAGRLLSTIEKGPAKVTLSGAYGGSQSDFAFEEAQESHPGPAGVATAERQLMNEKAADAEVRGALSVRYWRDYAVRVARLLKGRQYDYPFAFTDLSGTLRKNVETRDVLDDNDTLSIAFPARDTGWLLFSRSFRYLNYLSPERSAQNRLSSTYRAGLVHQLNARKVNTKNALFVGVSEDSIVYPEPGKEPGRFYRRVEFTTFSYFRNVPGFRNTLSTDSVNGSDSLSLLAVAALVENGALFYEGGRAFFKNGVIREAGISAFAKKQWTPAWSSAGWLKYSASTNEKRNSFGDFEKTSESGNLEAGVRGTRSKNRFIASLECKLLRSRFNGALTSHYVYINLVLNRDF
ncbi:MAG: hypothetical protein V1913_04690, partial [Fibrobacterota bacterium]